MAESEGLVERDDNLGEQVWRRARGRGRGRWPLRGQEATSRQIQTQSTSSRRRALVPGWAGCRGRGIPNQLRLSHFVFNFLPFHSRSLGLYNSLIVPTVVSILVLDLPGNGNIRIDGRIFLRGGYLLAFRILLVIIVIIIIETGQRCQMYASMSGGRKATHPSRSLKPPLRSKGLPVTLLLTPPAGLPGLSASCTNCW